MKIINYNYGYISAFDCSIHGKIVVSKKEWLEAILFLKRGARRWLPSYPWTVRVLREDILRGIKTKRGNLYNIRVTATEAVVGKFEHTGKYKGANYMFEVREHELKIISVFDAQAVCLCGWSITCTGERKKAELRAEYRKHLKRA